MKFVFVSGGVVSGLGKGIISASVSLLLKNRGFKVAPVKIDMYLNMDAGTLRPQEHGETFVLASGRETDQDMGNYERFLNEDLPPENYITAGQIYHEVIKKERAFEYKGDTVEAIPHVTNEITRRIIEAGKKSSADIVVVEFGGTVGEYQNGIFFEAARIMELKNPADVVHIHVVYLPFLKNIGELKSKPAQTSVHILNSLGIAPELIVARSEVPLDKKRADKIALFCNISPQNLILSPDLDLVYGVPELLKKQHMDKKILAGLKLRGKKTNGVLKDWQKMTKKNRKAKTVLTLALVTKYFKSGDFDLGDSYLSVLEALRHAGTQLGIKVEIKWLNSEEEFNFAGVSGLIVPQGWGSRGTEGMIRAVQFARENKTPYLGLCFGMQMAVIEFARNVCKMTGANSTEADPKTRFPVVHIMPDQEKYLAKKQYGGTIRLGQWPANLVKREKSKVRSLYKKYREFCSSYCDGEAVLERHRHRYEVNNRYLPILEKEGLNVAAVSPDGKLVEAIELSDHPFFMGTQFHPELQSRPLSPHPLFLGFLEACLKSYTAYTPGVG